MTTETHCIMCGAPVCPERWAIGRNTCLPCGEQQAVAQSRNHIIAIPYSKGAYQYVHDPRDLFNTNPKQTRG